MLALLKSLSLFGLQAEEIDIEVDIHKGLPKIIVVGLPDPAVQEARERVRSAIKNSGFTFPRGRVAVNLAPADLKKQGPRFDLPIALGILHSTEQIALPENIQQYIFVGELGFTGEIRPISGTLPTTAWAQRKGFKGIFVPEENADEASLIEDIEVFPAKTLEEVSLHLLNKKRVQPRTTQKIKLPSPEIISDHDMQHIRGNEHAKRALEIGASRSHNYLVLCL